MRGHSVLSIHAYRSGDWKKIPINENGQPLVQVPGEITFPFYARVMKLSKDERIYLREEVLERVFRVRVWLQSRGYDLKVYDGWRSIELQENLFWYYMRAFTADKFGRKEEFNRLNNLDAVRSHFDDLPPDVKTVMLEANRTYVSWPSKNPLCPSPHATGGAVDIWLFKDGNAANLGVPFDWMEEDAGAFYHLKIIKKRFKGNNRRICNNRNFLLLAMVRAGFSCYGPEVWHFNYGNQMDALIKGGHACYSYIEP